MSTPRNHHFVSQVHINKFFNKEDGRIYLHDKKLNNSYSKTSTKSIFSERDLNSKFEAEEIDHSSLEQDLNTHFESDFNEHYNSIRGFLEHLEYTDEVNHALFYMAKYGIIGEFRNPSHKKNIEKSINELFSFLSGNCTEELQKQLDETLSYQKHTKYSNTIKYSKFADDIIDKMGELIFRIEIAVNKADYFLLGDFCAANRREKINTYFNPDIKEIAYIGLPLSSKIYLHFYSTKIDGIKIQSGIFPLGSDKVDMLNRMNFDYCDSKVACENEEYLNYFIKNVVSSN